MCICDNTDHSMQRLVRIGWLNPYFYNPGCKFCIQPSHSSVQNIWMSHSDSHAAYMESQLQAQLALTGSFAQQIISIAKQPEKKRFLRFGLLIRHPHRHIWPICVSKRHLPEPASDQHQLCMKIYLPRMSEQPIFQALMVQINLFALVYLFS